jgi:large subunit ribosomal protein L10
MEVITKMATKAFKSEKIEAIKESLAKAKVVVVTDYRGLSVAEITALRRELQKEQSDFAVVKNTLAKLAIKDTQFAGLEELLQGPSGLALGFGDQTAPAKILTAFIKKAKKSEIKGAVLDGKVFFPKDVARLAELPSKEQLYAKMLGCVNSPATGLVNTVSGVARALVTAMDAVRKQKESA